MHPDSQEILADFFQHMKIEKRASEHTLKNYQRDIKQLQNYCLGKGFLHWQEIQAADIRNHIANRHRKGMSSKSLQRELSAIRSLYNYFLKKRCVKNNPAVHIRAPKQERKLPKVSSA